MISDALAVAWKEWRELIRARTTRIGGLVMVFVFGVFLPLQGRVSDASSPFQVLTWAVIPFALTIPLIADSIAGERERHTLETLLATRLTEGDILLGKMGTSVAYAFGGSLVVQALQSVVWSARAGTFVAPPLALEAAGMLVALGVALVAASAGVLVSLRAKTVRQAQQILGLSFAGVYILGIIVVTSDALADFRRSTLRFALENSPAAIALVAAACLGLLAAVLIAACRALFQRQKLLLD